MMRLSATEQIITDTNMKFISLIIHGQPYISRTMKDFSELSELFLIYTFFKTTADNVNITKVKKYGEMPRDQR